MTSDEAIEKIAQLIATRYRRSYARLVRDMRAAGHFNEEIAGVIQTHWDVVGRPAVRQETTAFARELHEVAMLERSEEHGD